MIKLEALESRARFMVLKDGFANCIGYSQNLTDGLTIGFEIVS